MFVENVGTSDQKENNRGGGEEGALTRKPHYLKNAFTNKTLTHRANQAGFLGECIFQDPTRLCGQAFSFLPSFLGATKSHEREGFNCRCLICFFACTFLLTRFVEAKNLPNETTRIEPILPVPLKRSDSGDSMEKSKQEKKTARGFQPFFIT